MLQTLRARLTAVSVLVVTLALAVLSGVAFVVVRGNVMEMLDERIGGMTRLYANELSDWAQTNQRIAGSIKAAVPLADPLPALLAAKQAGGFDDAYFVFADNRSVFPHPLPEGYSGVDRPWFQQGKQEGKATLTPAYVDATTGKLTISFIEPVLSGGQLQAVVGADVHLDSVVNKVKSIQPTAQSFAFLLDGQSNILAHANQALLLKPAQQLDPALNAQQLARLTQSQGHTVVPVGGKDHFLYAAKVAGTPWMLVVAAERAEALSSLDRLGQVAMTSTVLCVIAAALVMAAVVRRMLGRLVAVRDALQDIASGEGDLTRRLPVERDDEIGAAAAGFNRMLETVAELVREVKRTVTTLEEATAEMARSGEAVRAGAKTQNAVVAQVRELIGRLHEAAVGVAAEIAAIQAESQVSRERTETSRARLAASAASRSSRSVSACCSAS